jgi:hypothetical protein
MDISRWGSDFGIYEEPHDAARANGTVRHIGCDLYPRLASSRYS